jgi:hypothetical protein
MGKGLRQVGLFLGIGVAVFGLAHVLQGTSVDDWKGWLTGEEKPDKSAVTYRVLDRKYYNKPSQPAPGSPDVKEIYKQMQRAIESNRPGDIDPDVFYRPPSRR